MINNNYRVNLTYFLLYISLLLGFFLQEDVTLGQIKDYLIHEEKADIFKKNIINGFLKYEEYPNITHSPIYILYKIILENIFHDKILARFFNLHFSLLIPFFFYKCLEVKYKNKITDYKIFIPVIFFLSPYYRAGSIWLDDNITAIIFFIVSIFFFLKFQNQKKKIIFLFLNAIFLAAASYLRPIYSLFSIYFFIIFVYELKFCKKVFYYILFNCFLAAPALYYVFILKINGWFAKNLLLSNPITILSLVSSIVFLYSLPMIFANQNWKKIKYTISGVILSLLFLILQKLYFNYDLNYSGGAVFRILSFLSIPRIFFFILGTVSLYFIYHIFFKPHKNKIFFTDIILLIILIFLEIDGIVYAETYDPLIYLVFFLLIKNKIFSDYLDNFSKRNLIILLLFTILNYLLFAFKFFLFYKKII
jgi:hypothetical protein